MKLIMGLLGLVSLIASSLATANTVSFFEGTSILTGGVSPITLTLQGDFSVDAVTGGDMIINWDPGILTFVSGAAAAGWSYVDDTGFGNDGSGGSMGFSSTWEGAVSNSGVNQQFATFTFNVVGSIGSFTDVVTVSDNINFTGWSGLGGSNLPTTYNPIQVGVSAVPLPAAAWLFASGMLGMVGVARRRQTRAA